MSNSLFPSQPECAADPGSLCGQIYRLTDSDFLARSADTIFAAGSQILLVLILALIARWFLHRLITRIVAGATSNPVSKPLTGLAPVLWDWLVSSTACTRCHSSNDTNGSA